VLFERDVLYAINDSDMTELELHAFASMSVQAKHWASRQLQTGDTLGLRGNDDVHDELACSLDRMKLVRILCDGILRTSDPHKKQSTTGVLESAVLRAACHRELIAQAYDADLRRLGSHIRQLA